MKKINFALVIHNHQPVDNDSNIIEEVYTTAYSPFLKKLSEFPLIKANLHYSGYLLEWLQKEHPEFIELLSSMVKRKQVEILGGGYYEPVLPCIPDEDAKGQIDLLSEKVNSLFGSTPEGLWTAERVWEPRSPELLQDSGIRYTLVDDTIFMSAGVPEERCFQPYIVESRASVVTVFPIIKTLRYLIPWKTEWNTVAFLRRNADGERNRLAVFGDDGEKLGSWPTTYEKVYTKGWLDGFFKLLIKNGSWLMTTTLSDYLAEFGAHERTYLPSASYDEMMEWSLPEGNRGEEDPRNASDTRGIRTMRGLWRLFLSKYPEGGRLYSKMLSVSKMVHDTSDDAGADALREIWKGQFNDVYWHGAFGGLYAANLRRIAYHHIINAQKMTESLLHPGEGWLTMGQENFNGNTEFTIDTASLGLRVCPSLGGSLAELDFKIAAVNILDVISRKREMYHVNLSKPRRSMLKKARGIVEKAALSAREESRELLLYDRYPKFSFQDFLVDDGTVINDFLRQTFMETASFAGQPYDPRVEMTAKDVTFNLSRKSELRSGESTVSIQKSLRVPSEGSEITFRYHVQMTPEHVDSKSKLMIEINLSSLGDRAFAREYVSPVVRSSVMSQELSYPEVGPSVYLRFSRPVDISLVPLRTVSRSESGFQTTLQGISILVGVELLERSRVSDVEIALGLSA